MKILSKNGNKTKHVKEKDRRKHMQTYRQKHVWKLMNKNWKMKGVY